jgi:hypothetical protein
MGWTLLHFRAWAMWGRLAARSGVLPAADENLAAKGLSRQVLPAIVAAPTGAKSPPHLARRVWAGAVALAVAALVGLPAAGHAGVASQACPGPAPSPDFPCIAALNYPDADGKVNKSISPTLLLLDQGLRRLVAIYSDAYYQLEIDTPTGVSSQFSRIGVGSGFVSAAATLDAERHRLFLGSGPGPLSLVPTQSSQSSPMQIAVRSLADPSFQPPLYNLATAPDRDPVSAQELSGQQIFALAYDAPRKVLFALTHNTKPIVDLSPVTGVSMLAVSADGTLNFKWYYPMPGCLAPLGNHPFLGVADGGKLLYFACKGEGQPATSPPTSGYVGAASHLAMVVNMETPAPKATDGFVTEDYPFAGDLTHGQSWGDQVGERLFLGAGGAGVQKFFIFDPRHRAWIGSRPLSSVANVLGAAADPATGRIYPMQSDDPSMYLINGAQLPTSQGERVSLGSRIDGTVPQQPVFDPVSRRLFVAGPFRGNYASDPGPGTLRVYQDNTPPALPTPNPDPDAATHDINESNAVNVKAGGEGSAFGTRATFVGGFQQSAVGSVTQQFGSNGPQPGNRNLFAAQVSLAQMSGDASSGGTAKAESQGAGLDKATADDFRSRGFPYDSFMAGTGEFVPATCSDLGNPDDTKAQTNVSSSATCQAGQSAVASASANGPMDLSPVKVAHSHAEVTVQRDPALGVIVTSTAVAKGIDIAGGLHIGEVRSIAVSRAHGRPGTAKSVFSTSINQVRIANPTTGETVFACGWAPSHTEGTDDPNGRCDPTAVARAIDQYYGFTVHAEAGKRDGDVSVFNSPGGAQASVIKDPYSYWSQFNINSDGGREVYGLQLTVFDDNLEASDVVVQLAGVRTQANYTVGAPKPAAEPDASGSTDATVSGDDPRPFNPLAQDSTQTTYIRQVSNTQPAALTIQNLARVIRRIFHQVAQGVRFLVRHPAEAGLFGMVWALMGAPLYLGRRRFLGALVTRTATT